MTQLSEANRKSFLADARKVIGIEASALGLLAASLDTAFDRAVSILLEAEGRVIVSGMGKSGHIGRKVAATFASTGTPALFVHPAEASHGDLGMMARGDVALLLSNSGETPELSDVIAYTRRFAIPLIGVASNPNSTLLMQSDVAIALPEAEEACGTGVVPTTTTTMTLALGDALALALMKYRDFSPENFREFHPGGKLGARLSSVAALMHTGPALPLVNTHTPMSETLIEMTKKGFGVVGVVDDTGTLAGIITDGDLRRHMDGLLEVTAESVMTPSPRSIAPEALAEEAVAMMSLQDPQITCLFVIQEGDGKPVGILHIHDCLRAGIA